MLKIRMLTLALAGLSALSAARARAAAFTQDFSADPLSGGWQIVGDTNLFQWDSTNHNLLVTWDSSRSNSYFLHPLGTILAKDDDFSLAFDLRLQDIAIGVDTNKPYTFQIAVGFINLAQATATNFLRGTGFNSPNLVEFNYFPDSGFGPTVSPVLISSNSQFAYSFLVEELTTNDLFHVEMAYTAADQTLRTTMTRNGEAFGPVGDATLGIDFSDFREDTVAVCSYSDAGQDPMFAGSILAHGTVDNFAVTMPPPPVETVAGAFSNTTWLVEFASRSNWLYTLERSSDFHDWTGVSPATAGNGTNLSLPDVNPPSDEAYYRVRAQRP